MHNPTRVRDRLAALQHRARSNNQNNIAKETARVCSALERSLIASRKEASSVYPHLRAYRHSLARSKSHKQLPFSSVSSLRFIHTTHPFCWKTRISAQHFQLISLWQLHPENQKSLLSSSGKQTISQSNLLAVRKHRLNFHSTQFKGQRVVFSLHCSIPCRPGSWTKFCTSEASPLPAYHASAHSRAHTLSLSLFRTLFHFPLKKKPKLMSLAKYFGSQNKKTFQQNSKPNFSEQCWYWHQLSR